MQNNKVCVQVRYGNKVVALSAKGDKNSVEVSNSEELITDLLNLAEQAKSFGLMDAIATHLTRSYDDYFAVARLVVKDSSATLTLDDGNDNVFATQQIEYTDFPLNEIKLYCSFDGEYWVVMLTSEY